MRQRREPTERPLVRRRRRKRGIIPPPIKPLRHVRTAEDDARTTISPLNFYTTEQGHSVRHLRLLLPAVRPHSIVWLCGDTALDNKAYINVANWMQLEQGDRLEALNGYEAVLDPPKAAPDLAYWLNRLCVELRLGWACVNTAVDESTLGERQRGMRGDGAGLLPRLLPQDQLVRDHLRADDTLVVCVGLNDLLLQPSAATRRAVQLLLRCPPRLLRSGRAPGTLRLVRLLREETLAYVRALIGRCRPRRIVLCRPYHPAECDAARRLSDEQLARKKRAEMAEALRLASAPGASPHAVAALHAATAASEAAEVAASGSWAAAALNALSYDAAPAQLHALLDFIFERARAGLTAADVDGVDLVQLNLHEHLDAAAPDDYEQRVAPSVAGAQKLAHAIVAAALSDAPPPPPSATPPRAPAHGGAATQRAVPRREKHAELELVGNHVHVEGQAGRAPPRPSDGSNAQQPRRRRGMPTWRRVAAYVYMTKVRRPRP